MNILKHFIKHDISKDRSIDDNHKAIEGNDKMCTQCGKILESGTHTYNTWPPSERQGVLCGDCSIKALGRLTGR